MFNLLVKTMKKIFYIILTLIFSFQFITAQNISSGEVGKKYDIISGFDLVDDFFVTSFEKANWDKYRYEDNRRTLVFDNGDNAKEFTQNMLKNGVILRHLIGFGLPECVRVTIGTVDENKFFIEKLNNIMEKTV